MKFNISCDVYYRLSQILSYIEPDTDEQLLKQINCIRLENINGKTIAIATNKKVAAIELCGNTNEPNGVFHLVVDEQLVNLCKKEKAFNSVLEIVHIPEIGAASVKSMLGFQYQGNPSVYLTETPLDDWRRWAFNKSAVVSYCAYQLDINHMLALNASSLSGIIIFPEIIDSNIPTILRDRDNPNWVGLFYGRPPIVNTPAILPEWWNK